MGKKVVLGFSGGIDSFAAVKILRAQELEVVALTLDTMGDEVMLGNAVRRAVELGVEHVVVDVREEFRHSIIDYFASEYARGRTPAPCTICNSTIKWRALKEYAQKIGAEHIATGHYFRIEDRNGRKYVSRAADKAKDQSYYLWGLTQEVLEIALTPMAEMIKNQVVAALPTEKKIRESMGVCFLKGRWYGEMLRERAEIEIKRGNIVDRNGVKIGEHDGYPLYTIGQKRGVECSMSGCVTSIDPQNNQLVWGTNDDLRHRNLIVSSCNIVDMDEATSADDITVMVRGFGDNPQGYATLETCDEGLHVVLEQPAWALSKGQPVVFYRNYNVIGGGILENYF